MDYRHTEAFAREMEAAGLRGKGLQPQLIEAFWHAFAARVRAGWAALVRRVLRPSRSETLFPEA